MKLKLGLEVDAAQFTKDWDSKYRKEIEKVIQAKPVSLKVDATGVKEALAAINEVKIPKDIIPKEVTDKYEKLHAQLKQLRTDWGVLGNIFNEATTTSEQFAVTKELQRVEAEIDSTMRQIDALDKSISGLRRKTGIVDSFRPDIADQGIQQRMSAFYKEEEAAAKETARIQAAAAKKEDERLKTEEKINREQEKRQHLLNGQLTTISEMQAKLKLLKNIRMNLPVDSPKFKYLEREIYATQSALNRYNGAQIRSSYSARRHNNALKEQKGLLNGLPQFLNAYVSILGGIRFAQNIKNITAEFDMQKRALGAIIQDAEMANRLFRQTLNLAVSSPFTAKQLIGYVKQLSAYRIESSKLFDTTKMLADVSAGLGVSLDRIILAYGQIRAKGRLAGSELRQLTEAGIPAVEMLAEKFSQLRGRVVSTSEVFDMISKRQVYFEDVEQMFKDLTSSGGMFFNMQEKIADTLYGVWQKLGDAMQIAMSEIGKDNMGVLRGAAEALLFVAKHLKTIYDVSVKGAYAWGLYKVAMIASNKAMTRANFQMSIMSKYGISLNRRLIMLRLSLRGLTQAVKRLWFSMVRNPITLVAAGFGLLAEYISKLLSTNKEQKDIIEEVSKAYDLQRALVNQLAYEYDNLAKKQNTYKDKFKLLLDLVKDMKKANKDFSIDMSIVTPENIDSVFSDVKDKYDEIILYTKYMKIALNDDGVDESIADAGSSFNELKNILGDTNKNFALLGQRFRDMYSGLSDYEKGLVDNFLIVKREGEAEEESLRRRILLLDKIKYTSQNSASGQKTSIWEVRGANRKLFGEMTDYVKAAINAQDNLIDSEDKVRSAVKETVSEFKKANLGLDFNNLTDAQKKNIAISIKATFDEKEGWTDFQQRLATKIAASELKIPLSFFTPAKTDYQDLKQWIQDFNSAVGAGTFNEESQYPKAVSEAVKVYKDAKNAIELYSNAQKKGILVDKDKQDYARKLADDIYKLATKYGFLQQLLDKTNVKHKDDRQQSLQAEINTVKEAYKQYEKLRKLMGDRSAFDKVSKAFSDLFKDFSFTKGFVPTSHGELAKYLQDVLKLNIGDKKFKFNIGIEASDESMAAMEKQLKDSLKKMQESIARTKEAQSFFQGLLSNGQDMASAFSMTLSIYGVDPQSIRDQLKENLKTALDKTFDEDVNMNMSFGDLERKIKGADIGETQKDNLMSLLKDLQDYDAETIRTLQKNLSAYSEYELKRMQIMREGIEERRRISETDAFDDVQKKELTQKSMRKEKSELDKIDFEQFKKSDLYIRMFEDLEHVSVAALDRMERKLIEYQQTMAETLSPDQLKVIQDKLNDIQDIKAYKNPFVGLGDDLKKWADALLYGKQHQKEFADASERAAEAQKQLDLYTRKVLEAEYNLRNANQAGNADNISAAQEELRLAKERQKVQMDVVKSANDAADLAGEQVRIDDQANRSMEKRAKKIGLISGQIQSITGSITDVLQMLGDDADTSETIATLNDISTLFGGIGDAIEGIYSGNPAQVINGIVGIGKSVFNFISGQSRRVAKMNKLIEQQKDRIDDLSFAYKNLEKITSKSLGSDRIEAVRKEQENLRNQADAYLKMYDAERRKGKDTDKDKLKSYLNSHFDTLDRINELQDELIEHMIGENRESAARRFAEQWLEAYKSFKSTSKAIKDTFDDMIDSLIVNAIMSKVAQSYIDPIYNALNTAMNDNTITFDEVGDIVKLAGTQAVGMNEALKKIMEGLELAGVNIKSGESNLTGISAAAAGITEDTALTLGAIGNNLVYYVVGIHDLLQSHYSGDTPGVNDGGVSLVAIQQNSLAEIRAIHGDTTRIAIATEKLTDQIASVTAPLGTKAGAKAINVNV